MDNGSTSLLGCANTLENSTQILELLEYIDFSEGMNKQAQFGLFLVLEMLIESLRQVSDGLKGPVSE